MIMQILEFFRGPERHTDKPADLIQFDAARERLEQRSAELKQSADIFGDMIKGMRGERRRKKAAAKNGAAKP